jgi:hypothetical protein
MVEPEHKEPTSGHHEWVKVAIIVHIILFSVYLVDSTTGYSPGPVFIIFAFFDCPAK